MIAHTPSGFVAGVVPCGDNPKEAAWHAARGALDETAAIKLVVSAHEGRTWFIAAPARCFSSAPEAGTPLGCALPGMPDHAGPGAYVADTDDRRTAVIVVDGQGLKSFVGERDEVEDYAAQLGAVVIEPAHLAAWEGYLHGQAREAMRVTQGALRSGCTVAACAAVLWVGLAALSGQGEARIAGVQDAWNERAAATLRAAEAGRSNPVRAALEELQQVSDKAAHARGVIEAYRISSTGTYWQMVLPAWVNADYYQGLGPVSVEPSPDGKEIVVTRGRL